MWLSLFYISKRLGSRLFGTYLLIKLLYLANAVGQLYLMQSFIGLDLKKYSYFGATIAANILKGKDWQVSALNHDIMTSRLNSLTHETVY